MRLIDADALMPNAELKGANCIVTAYDIVKAPTIDAVPVIRCKDCKYYPRNPRSYDDNDEIYTYAMCGHLNGGEDGFCSNYNPFGERKEE